MGERTDINILVAGIPTLAMIKVIRERYAEKINLYVAECRPFEMQVARAIEEISATGIKASVVTDNMMAALINTVPIRAVWSGYSKTTGEQAVAINGSHMAALLAKAFGIPCILYPVHDLPEGETGRFAGEDIAVTGSNYISWEPDVVPLELISEIIDNG